MIIYLATDSRTPVHFLTVGDFALYYLGRSEHAALENRAAFRDEPVNNSITPARFNLERQP